MPVSFKHVSVPASFATCSIMSQPGEALPDKLRAIRDAGFDGIELSMPDILGYGKALNGEEPAEDDYEAITKVTVKIRALTDELGLRVLMLQPFPRLEGWTKGKLDKQREDAFRRARGWSKIMEAAGTDMLQIGSSDSEEISTSIDDLAADLAELADIFAEKGLRICYENWCWGTRAATWKAVWEIVKRADRPNLGLCLDTFQTAGSELADPTTASGLEEGLSPEALQKRWRASLAELAETIPADKIYLLQISDAYRMNPPLDTGKDEDGQPPRSRWSHDYRPLPGDGGYLPVAEVLAAVLKTGFRSWLSMEVFDGREKEKHGSGEAFTKAAMKSLQELLVSVEGEV